MALDPYVKSIDAQLIHEAKMMAIVGSKTRGAVCQLLYQPLATDETVRLASGRPQPVFIAMELVNADFGALVREERLSRAAMCEGFLLCFLALREVHRCGVLHRDLKLNNLGLCIDPTVQAAPMESDVCAPDPRVSARILDLGEAMEYRSGQRGPTNFGNCRSKYASIARHRRAEQGCKDDIEMLLYAYLDKLMTGGVPWGQLERGAQRQSSQHDTRLSGMKAEFRRCKGRESEMWLIEVLRALDAIESRQEPPYAMVQKALEMAWYVECRGHNSHRPMRLYDCMKLAI